ncbi:aldo-keto reductase family 1 member B7-like [Ostrea edulis]|uniref:aldo-keto reductase family 1 member B7-like n=1 Tax=Ostrea edulis TaxID=37623 RepID=UPI0024AF7AD5|nr:aldo-keto reductase family 1 member B7-like [Ostrea edulis]XP_056009877.1 aldo-keto reductase family 1 member B7-like [Ostrea edulis]
MAAEKVPNIPLPGTRGYPKIGLGTFTIFEKTGSNDEVKAAVRYAIDCGYRSIDCAFAYQNETSVGQAVNEKINEGVVKREDLFITTKLWDTHHNPANIRENFLKSLRSLNCGYVDLYLIHWPFGFEDGDVCFPRGDDGKVKFSDHDYMDVWKGMEKLVDEGLVKSIGLSNFNKSQIERVLQNCRIKPGNLQIEVHPYMSNKKLIDFCSANGISVTAYAPLGNPNRTWAGDTDPIVFEEPLLKTIAEKKNKTVAQVCLRFLLQRNIIVIPKSVTPHRIKENFDILDFKLTDDEMKSIWSMDKGKRFYAEDIAKDHKYYPFHDEY